MLTFCLRLGTFICLFVLAGYQGCNEQVLLYIILLQDWLKKTINKANIGLATADKLC